MRFASERWSSMVLLNKSTISVEVIYAKRDQQKMISLDIETGSTLKEAIIQSGILLLFPEIDLSKQSIGVFGVLKKFTDQAQTGDRIEIYRPLMIDPKEARRVKIVIAESL